VPPLRAEMTNSYRPFSPVVTPRAIATSGEKRGGKGKEGEREKKGRERREEKEEKGRKREGLSLKCEELRRTAPDSDIFFTRGRAVHSRGRDPRTGRCRPRFHPRPYCALFPAPPSSLQFRSPFSPWLTPLSLTSPLRGSRQHQRGSTLHLRRAEHLHRSVRVGFAARLFFLHCYPASIPSPRCRPVLPNSRRATTGFSGGGGSCAAILAPAAICPASKARNFLTLLRVAPSAAISNYSTLFRVSL